MLAMYLAMLETAEDQRRFMKLYNTYERKLYAVVLRILGDPSKAEDAVQQAWFQLIRSWERVSALPWEETEGYAAIRSGLWEKIRAALVERVRTDAERKSGPSYAIIDSQSVKTTSAAEERGIDGGKKQKDANGTS